MSFLENLYSNEYFVPVLFTVIAILSVLFVITLILAIKDANKSKKESLAMEPKEDSALSKVEESPLPLDFKAEDLVLDTQKEEVKEDNIIESITPINNDFESVNIEQPIEMKDELNIAEPTEIKDEMNIVEPNEDIKIETTSASADEVAQAENDLDLIAATLLKEYKKETPKEEVEVPQQFSSVFVTPDTLPNVEEEKKEEVENVPNFADIPAPTPVRVVESSTIIDSSKQENSFDINNIENEQYNIRK